MPLVETWRKSQPNTILFVLVDSNGEEVADLDDTFVLELSKTGNSFFTGTGLKLEVGSGWYKYVATAGESDTSGPIAIKVTGAGVVQQNLEYVVEDRAVTAREFTYTVTSTVPNFDPIFDVTVIITLDMTGLNVIWSGLTDMSGVARDVYGNLPRLEPGTYYFFRIKSGYIFNNPDVEVAS